MAFSTDVKLIKTKTPKFPARCVVCSGPSPDSKMGVGDFRISWFWFLTDIPDGWGSVKVPVHSGCRRPFKLKRWLNRLGYFVAAFAIWWLFGEQIEAMLPDALRNPGRKVILILLLIPIAFIDMLNPPRFDISISKHHVDFEFADRNYAAAFAKVNNELRRYEEINAGID